MAAGPETPLQMGFDGEERDTRTRKQRQADRKRRAPQQAEMFKPRDLAQFGVTARPQLPGLNRKGQPIEMQLQGDNNIETACVIGSGLPQPIALVLLSEIGVKLSQSELNVKLQDLLKQINPDLDQHERLQRMVVLQDQWTIENGIMTPTLKVKRNVVEDKYASQQETWFNAKERVVWQ